MIALTICTNLTAAGMRQGDTSIPVVPKIQVADMDMDWQKITSILQELETNHAQLSTLPSFVGRPPSSAEIKRHANLQSTRADLMIDLLRTSNRLYDQLKAELNKYSAMGEVPLSFGLSENQVLLLDKRLRLLEPHIPEGYRHVSELVGMLGQQNRAAAKTLSERLRHLQEKLEDYIIQSGYLAVLAEQNLREIRIVAQANRLAVSHR